VADAKTDDASWGRHYLPYRSIVIVGRDSDVVADDTQKHPTTEEEGAACLGE
jgi:hypothetical protein